MTVVAFNKTLLKPPLMRATFVLALFVGIDFHHLFLTVLFLLTLFR